MHNHEFIFPVLKNHPHHECALLNSNSTCFLDADDVKVLYTLYTRQHILYTYLKEVFSYLKAVEQLVQS